MHVTLTTYDTLRTLLSSLREGAFPLLVVSSEPGLGKSRLAKSLLSSASRPCRIIEGRITPAAFYSALYSTRDELILLDDADDLLHNVQSLNLLKQLCQTEEEKQISWTTTRSLPGDTPQNFYTTSSICILTNQWNRCASLLAPIADRGVLISFRPSIEAIHDYAKQFCHSEVWTFIGHFVHLLSSLSLRSYTIAQSMRESCHNSQWMHMLLESWNLSPLLKKVIELDLEYPSHSLAEKARLFCEQSGKKHATYTHLYQQAFLHTHH